MVAQLLGHYERALTRAPVLTTGAVAGVLMPQGWQVYSVLIHCLPRMVSHCDRLGFVGDALAQRFEKRGGHHSVFFDVQRSSAFTLYSLCWGAFGLRPWLHMLNQKFPGSSLQAVCQKVAMQQLVWNPTIYLPTFYAFNGLYRGQDFESLIAKVRNEYFNCLLYIWKVWMPVSFGIFAFVPVRHQAW
eukprot:Skav223420  [mRNA]  locus=scaffold350:373653:375470:+ [translate_table: standard]